MIPGWGTKIPHVCGMAGKKKRKPKPKQKKPKKAIAVSLEEGCQIRARDFGKRTQPLSIHSLAGSYRAGGGVRGLFWRVAENTQHGSHQCRRLPFLPQIPSAIFSQTTHLVLQTIGPQRNKYRFKNRIQTTGDKEVKYEEWEKKAG